MEEGDSDVESPKVGESLDTHPKHGSPERSTVGQSQDGYREYLHSDLQTEGTPSQGYTLLLPPILEYYSRINEQIHKQSSN